MASGWTIASKDSMGKIERQEHKMGSNGEILWSWRCDFLGDWENVSFLICQYTYNLNLQNNQPDTK